MKIFYENEEIEVFDDNNLFQMKRKIETIIFNTSNSGRVDRKSLKYDMQVKKIRGSKKISPFL